MNHFSHLIGITVEELKAQIKGAVTEALIESRPRRDVRTAEATKPNRLWLTDRQARAYTSLSRASLQRYRRACLLPFSKVGGKIYYRREDLDAFLSGAHADRAFA